MGPFGCKASCTFQCGKKHLWSLLSIFACFYGECSQILGQVLMKMWKWDYVRRKNDSPASKDSLQKRVYFSTALWQKNFAFPLEVIKKISKAFLTTSGRLQLLTMRRDKKRTPSFFAKSSNGILLTDFFWFAKSNFVSKNCQGKKGKMSTLKLIGFQLFLRSALLHNFFCVVTSDDLSILDPNVLLSKRERKGSHLTSVTRPVMGGLVIILNVKAMS